MHRCRGYPRSPKSPPKSVSRNAGRSRRYVSRFDGVHVTSSLGTRVPMRHETGPDPYPFRNCPGTCADRDGTKPRQLLLGRVGAEVLLGPELLPRTSAVDPPTTTGSASASSALRCSANFRSESSILRRALSARGSASSQGARDKNWFPADELLLAMGGTSEVC